MGGWLLVVEEGRRRSYICHPGASCGCRMAGVRCRVPSSRERTSRHGNNDDIRSRGEGLEGWGGWEGNSGTLHASDDAWYGSEEARYPYDSSSIFVFVVSTMLSVESASAEMTVVNCMGGRA